MSVPKVGQVGKGFEAKLKASKLRCTCWTHLREAGLTPPASRAEQFPDYGGRQFNSADGSATGKQSRGKPADKDIAAAIRNREAI